MFENLQRWLKIKAIGKNTNQTFSGQPKTSDYQPINRTYWQTPRDLPPFNFITCYNMLLDGQVRAALTARAAPLFGVEFSYKQSTDGPEGKPSWTPGVQSRRPEVGIFINRQLQRIWRNHLHEIVLAQVWGWSAGEITLKLGTSKMVEFDRYEARHAQDVRLLLRNGKPFGVRFNRIKNHGNLDLAFPDCFFHCHQKDPGQHYGSSVMLGAYNPWADKWLDGGALDVRRLFMHKDAYGSDSMGYPDGETYINNVAVPNRDIAMQICEQIRSGNTVVRPSERDEHGQDRWPHERASVPANPAHILQYPKDLDSEIRTGIGVYDGVIDNDDGGASQAGKRIPMAAFYASLDTWVTQIINDLTEQVLESLVMLNWGRAEDFQITHKPLAEQAMEQQSNSGAGLEQPGQDAMMPPGMEGGDPSQELYGQGGGGDEQPDEMEPARMSLMRAVGAGRMSAEEAVTKLRRINAVTMALRGEFDETKHKRAADGKFATKEGTKTNENRGDPVGKPRHDAVTRLRERNVKGRLTNDQIWQEIDDFETKPDRYSDPLGAVTHDDPMETPANAEGTPAAPENKHVYTVPTSSLNVDAERFQYKVSGIGDKGVTKELSNVKTWNPELGGVLLVWRDPANGKDYVVNGHHRHELAGRAGAEELNVRYIDVPTAVEARARGALANIAEGRGSALDAAKYLRDSGADVEHLKRAGVSLSGRVASMASVLVDLGEKSFQKLAEGYIEESQAVAVASNLKDPALQDKLFQKLEDKDWTKHEIETAAKKMANAGKYTEKGTDLFGDFEDEQSTFDQEVEIESYVAKRLAREANDFRSVANVDRAKRVESAGNVLAVEENAKRQAIAEIMSDTFSREAALKGPVSAMVKKMAAELAEADTRSQRNAIKADALKAIRNELEKLEAPEGSKYINPDDFNTKEEYVGAINDKLGRDIRESPSGASVQVDENWNQRQGGLLGEDYEPGQWSDDEKQNIKDFRGETQAYNPQENQDLLFHGLQDDPNQSGLFGNMDKGSQAKKVERS